MRDLGRRLGLVRIEALVHVDHPTSARVLEKAGFTFEEVLRRHANFPELGQEPQDVRGYAWVETSRNRPELDADVAPLPATSAARSVFLPLE